MIVESRPNNEEDHQKKEKWKNHTPTKKYPPRGNENKTGTTKKNKKKRNKRKKPHKDNAIQNKHQKKTG